MTHHSTVREAVGVFEKPRDLEAAIDDLLSHGFDRAEISLLARSDAVEQKLGRAYRKVEDVEDDILAPRIAYVAREDVGAAESAVIGGLLYIGAMAGLIPIVASGGAVAAGLLAITLGGGGGAVIGALLARMIGAAHATYIEDQLNHGGLLLWVRTWNDANEAHATKILTHHSGKDVHLHGLPEAYPVLEERYLGARSKAETPAFRGHEYVRGADGEFLAAGHVFATREEASDYRERLDYNERSQSAAAPISFDLVSALRDPADMFSTPDQLLQSHLPKPLKSELLRRWAYDARSIHRADTEGMRGPAPDNLLQDIECALAQLSQTA